MNHRHYTSHTFPALLWSGLRFQNTVLKHCFIIMTVDLSQRMLCVFKAFSENHKFVNFKQRLFVSCRFHVTYRSYSSLAIYSNANILIQFLLKTITKNVSQDGCQLLALEQVPPKMCTCFTTKKLVGRGQICLSRLFTFGEETLRETVGQKVEMGVNLTL